MITLSLNQILSIGNDVYQIAGIEPVEDSGTAQVVLRRLSDGVFVKMIVQNAA